MHEQQPFGGGAPQLVSIRRTAASDLVLHLCEQGTSHDKILSALGGRWPTVPKTTLLGLVMKLTRLGFLLTDLLPVDLDDDPVRHLLARLPDGGNARAPLQNLRNLLQAADLLPVGDVSRLVALNAARKEFAQLCGQDSPLCVDVAVDADITVPRSLLEEAAEAISVLWTMSCVRPTLAAFHSRFVERWGLGRPVSFLDVLDPVIGLGENDIETGIESAEASPDRIAVLADLLGDATAHGRIEIVLDDTAIAALAMPGTEPPPPGAEAYTRVIAASEQDLAAGRLHLALHVGGTQDAGSTLGRFTSLIPDLQPFTTGVSQGALLAEVVSRPRIPILATVAPPTGLTPVRLPVGIPPEQDDLRLDDLLLVADEERLTLWSRARRCPIMPVLNSRIGLRYLPAPARLLALLGRSGCRPWCLFSWGSLRDTAFQPRIRYRSTILAPARWRLPKQLTGCSGNACDWPRQLRSWRTETLPRPPAVVVTDDDERQLPLDLDDERDVELLRRYVHRGLSAVTEPPGGAAAVQDVVTARSGRHLLELVIPLSTTVPRTAPGRVLTSIPRAQGEGLHLPGGEWLSLAVTAPPTQHDEILADLATLLPSLRGLFDRWFWLRYRTQGIGPHLRIRFHGDPQVLGGHLLPSLRAWGGRLVDDALASGFVVEPYVQEVERYGGPTALEAAEDVFAADSDLVLATLVTVTDPDQRLALAATTAVTVARLLAGGDPAALGRPHLDKTAHRRLAGLRQVVDETACDDACTFIALSATREKYVDALLAYHDRLPVDRRADCASSVIHMHSNRLLADTALERMVRVLATGVLAREASRR
ncbi:MAG: lantibiotic biosynthesis protein [Actinomycetota bacterium]|nr:lantibiotic biosynthesis protein [Actinomycetota bacterium]